MSRTYRYRKDEWIIKNSLTDWVWNKETWSTHRIKIDPRSKEGKVKIAKTKADSHCGWYGYNNGPGWFIREFIQSPYRVKCKKEITQYMHGKVEDVVLESKPHRVYWD